MEKRRRNLIFSVILMGMLFATAGIVNTILFKNGYYQEMILKHNFGAGIIAFLSVAVFVFGVLLMLSCIEIVEKIEDFFKGWGALEILFYVGGSLLVVIGTGNLILFGFGYYQELSLVSPAKYFTIMVLSFFSIYVGFFVARFRIIVSGWITEFFKKRKEQQV